MNQIVNLWPFAALGLGIFLVIFAGSMAMPASTNLVRFVARTAGWFTIIVFVISITGTWFRITPPFYVPWILWHWIINGVLTFFIFKYDKRNSKIKDMWRINSEWLFVMSLMGGGFGAWLGRNAAKHKTNYKEEGCFIYFNWAMLVLNILLWVGLYLWQIWRETFLGTGVFAVPR